MKKLVFILLISISSIIYAQVNVLHNILHEIGVRYYDKPIIDDFMHDDIKKMYHDLSLKLVNIFDDKLTPLSDSLLTINTTADTLYCFYKFSPIDNQYEFALWNRHDTVIYNCWAREHTYTDLFTQLTAFPEMPSLGSMIGQWDTTTIMQQSVKYPPGVVFIHDNHASLMASRIIINNGNYSIESIEFSGNGFSDVSAHFLR